ncbi:hypothetical protein AB0T83_12865 [Fluviibacterium sp. DFM31]|uniref:Uncharacterized protein n=1 Tax=Meridianimarinicoccus marinus TaxID=3231483 RepID=A0ABV3L9E2_9RHOB
MTPEILQTQLPKIAGLALACCVALPAAAESIRLEKAAQAASIHQGGVDLVAYYIDMNAHLDVVATFVDGTDDDLPARLRLGLRDGDVVTFTVPNRPDVAFRITRTGALVEVQDAAEKLSAVVPAE